MERVAKIEIIPMINVGSSVMLRSKPGPRYPANVMVPSASTRANVPASVDNRPPLYVPLASREDITLDNNERLTPAIIENKKRKYQVIKLKQITSRNLCQERNKTDMYQINMKLSKIWANPKLIVYPCSIQI